MSDPVFNQWTPRVIFELERTPHRFNSLVRVLDAPSPRMLSKLLKRLERDGIIVRTVHRTEPPANVVYSLSELGRELGKSTSGLLDFWRQHQGEIRERRFIHSEAARAAEIQAHAV
jgi:DNA-binding HxlR family transcriptional regulator